MGNLVSGTLESSVTVDAAARHCVEVYEDRYGRRVDVVVLLYANVPVRRNGAIDRAVRHLIDTGADSVRTVAPVGKRHPLWLHRLDGDRMVQYAANDVYRRQDLDPLYYHDGAVVVVRRFSRPAPGWRGTLLTSTSQSSLKIQTSRAR